MRQVDTKVIQKMQYIQEIIQIYICYEHGTNLNKLFNLLSMCNERFPSDQRHTHIHL